METINANSDHINASFVFINASCIYKNKACVYRLLPIKNNFAIGPKEVYIGRRRTYLLIDYRLKKRFTEIYSSLAVPPMLRIYSFGVTPVLFLNDRKKEARELKPQSSANAVNV